MSFDHAVGQWICRPLCVAINPKLGPFLGSTVGWLVFRLVESGDVMPGVGENVISLSRSRSIVRVIDCSLSGCKFLDKSASLKVG